MRFISLDEAPAGSVLNQDVTDRRGRVLMRASQELSPKRIEALRTWGITHISIAGESEERPSLADLPSDVQEQVLARVGDDFGGADLDHPLMRALYDKAIARQVDALSRGSARRDVE